MVHRNVSQVHANIVVLLHLQVVNGKLLVSAEDGSAHPRQYGSRDPIWDFCSLGTQDVDYAMAKAIKIAEAIGEKEELKGFDMKDLRKVAKAFRLG